MGQKIETFHVRRLYHIVYNAAKILGPGVKLGQEAAPMFGKNAKNADVAHLPNV